MLHTLWRFYASPSLMPRPRRRCLFKGERIYNDYRILGSSISSLLAQAVSHSAKLQGYAGITDRNGKSMAGIRGREAGEDLRDLSLRSRLRRQSSPRYLPCRSRRLRTDGSRCAALDQEQGGSDVDLPPLLPGGGLRVMRHEPRRHQLARCTQFISDMERRQPSTHWPICGSSRTSFPT